MLQRGASASSVRSIAKARRDLRRAYGFDHWTLNELDALSSASVEEHWTRCLREAARVLARYQKARGMVCTSIQDCCPLDPEAFCPACLAQHELRS